MLTRTHLVISIFFGLVLLKFSQNPFWFFGFLIIGTLLPDLDSYNSRIGKHFFSRVLTSFTKHRGIMHSFLFLFLIGIILYFYLKVAFFGFLVGYLIHIICDSFTRQGVRIFYPSKFRIHGILKTGGKLEGGIFLIAGILDLILIFEFILKSIF